MPGKTLYGFDQLNIGQEWESAGRQVTQADVVAFAALTGDRNPVHLDPGYAQTTPFRRCVAQGLLGLSLAAGLTGDALPVRTVALTEIRDWRFLAPVFPGDMIRARCRVAQKQLRGRGRRATVIWQIQVLNQNDQVVQEGMTVSVVEVASTGASSHPDNLSPAA